MPELDPAEKQWAQTAGAELRRQETQLHDETRQKLLAARQAAVAAADERSRPAIWWPQLTGAGALAAAVLVWVILGFTSVDTLPNMDETEMAAAQEVELLEDLEFVAWIVAMEEVDDISTQG